MRVQKCKQVIDLDQCTTTVKEERNKTLLHQMKLSSIIIFSFGYIGAHSDLTQVMTLNKKKNKKQNKKKTESSTTEVNWT